MAIYARPGRRMAQQVMGDLGLVVWVLGWAWAGRQVWRAVAGLAVPARASGNLASQMADQMQHAQDQASQIPGLGDVLGGPFGALRQGLGQVVQLSEAQAVQVHHVAVIVGWLCFVIPVLVGLLLWLPRRVRFVRQASLTQQFIDADADLELFALRGMAHLPMQQVARISSDPVGDWRRGDKQVVRALAKAELDRMGLDLRLAPDRQGDTAAEAARTGTTRLDSGPHA